YLVEIDDLKVKLELSLQELAKTKHRNEVNQLQFQLIEKTLLADKYDQERACRLDLEARVEAHKCLEETVKSLTLEAEKERVERQAIQKSKDELERTVALQVSKAELISAQEAADEQRQLCQVLEVKILQLEQSVKDVETSRDSVVEQLESEKKLRLSTEGRLMDMQLQLANEVATDKYAELREELDKETAALEESQETVRMLTEKLENEKNLRRELAEKVAALEKGQGEDTTQTLKAKLEATLEDLEQERRAKAECNMRLQEIEQLLEDQKVDSENLHHSLSEK
ncbi:unnamed protein product, partial [Candidula unifasciata]